jgi:Fe-S cluster assembly iron-binding protein IscA
MTDSLPQEAGATRPELNRGAKSASVEATARNPERRAMLTLTENASTIVRDITAQQGMPETAGLRITTESAGDQAGFAISAADQPQTDDQVVEQSGATIYLDRASAELLDDKILDAAVDEQGRVEFALAIAP